ncbi:PIN domain-containing protein [Rhodoferax antarcticus]|uniref:PIN domain-containing protein n=1 Tax=Rhodoferax antarcticus TaxID=81479 RepID=UPI002224E8DE|nr:PIN domain-containing protein [Rhodoferax antarcticus]MCW2311870.1 putative nucleic acid-binding protein [Rhodoferax antarcticus]
MKSNVLWAIDTNILVYATAPDTPASKQKIAHDLLQQLFTSPLGCLPGQVLSEYLAVVLRKKTMPLALAMETVGTWAQAAKVLPVSEAAYQQAWALATSHQYQVWDALIVAVCAEHGVKTLYSEDAGAMKKPLGVQVFNPFAPA